MHYLIGIALVVVVIVVVVRLTVGIVAYLALILTAPSRSAMRLVQLAGLTDPVWYEVVHVVLGVTVAVGAHLTVSRLRKVLATRSSRRG